MQIDWKLISYLMAFIAGVSWGRQHLWLCLAVVALGIVSYWYIDHSTINVAKRGGEK